MTFEDIAFKELERVAKLHGIPYQERGYSCWRCELAVIRYSFFGFSCSFCAFFLPRMRLKIRAAPPATARKPAPIQSIRASRRLNPPTDCFRSFFGVTATSSTFAVDAGAGGATGTAAATGAASGTLAAAATGRATATGAVSPLVESSHSR